MHKVKVFIKWIGSKEDCICLQSKCNCEDTTKCERVTLPYDRYKNIEKCFKQDKYGK